jgi:hypothetical protein
MRTASVEASGTDFQDGMPRTMRFILLRGIHHILQEILATLGIRVAECIGGAKCIWNRIGETEYLAADDSYHNSLFFQPYLSSLQKAAALIIEVQQEKVLTPRGQLLILRPCRNRKLFFVSLFNVLEG